MDLGDLSNIEVVLTDDVLRDLAEAMGHPVPGGEEEVGIDAIVEKRKVIQEALAKAAKKRRV